jgi:hypothetical protein
MRRELQRGGCDNISPPQGFVKRFVQREFAVTWALLNRQLIFLRRVQRYLEISCCKGDFGSCLRAYRISKKRG